MVNKTQTTHRIHTEEESKYIRKLIEGYVFSETHQEQIYYGKLLQEIDFF